MVPFLLMSGEQPKLNTARVLEAVITATIIGGLTLYVTVNVMEERMKVMQQSINKLESKIDKLQSDLYIPRGDKLKNELKAELG